MSEDLRGGCGPIDTEGHCGRGRRWHGDGLRFPGAGHPFAAAAPVTQNKDADR